MARFQIGMKMPKILGATQLGTIKLQDYIEGTWAILLTFPQDFHPVWMTVSLFLLRLYLILSL